MFSLERATTTRRAGILTIVGLILVPLVVAGGFLWAGWNSADRLDRVQAAIVNNDKPIKINKQTVPLGRQLAGGLVSADDDPNFSWLITDDEDAAAGLASGEYAAVVTIPENFSKNATSYSKDESDEVKHATISVATSQITGLADPVVGQAITGQATKVLNATLTESYLKNIYIGFNKTGEQFGTLASAAGKLSDGTSGLSDGIRQTEKGTGQFASGLSQLDTGTAEFSAGLNTFSTGLDKYADGVGQYADGVDKLSGGATKLADGADRLSAGVTTAVRTFRFGTEQRPGGTKAYAKGVGQFADGLGTYQKTMQGLAASPDQLAGIVKCPVDDEQACALFYGGMQAGIGVGISGFENTKDAKGNTVPGLIPSAKKLAAGAAGIDGGLKQLGDPNSKKSLKYGVVKYADGMGEFASGAKKLAKGGHQLAGGADRLADGAGKLNTGAAKLADGTHKSADGAAKLYDGVGQLADGGDKLADGTSKFADGLDKGKDQIPSFDKTLRNKLSSVVTTPVKTPVSHQIFPNQASTTLLAVIALWLGALATFLIVRAVSGRVLSSMKSSWRLAFEGGLPAIIVGAVQALVLTGVVGGLLDLGTRDFAALAGFAVLTAVTFAMINHALVAWFGGVGRFISVAVLVLAAAGAITSALPEAFDAITPFLPTTPALEGLRAIVSNSGGAGNHAALLVGWLIIASTASILAVARRRMLSPLVAPVPA